MDRQMVEASSLSLSLFLSLQAIYLSIYLSIFLSIYLSISLSIYPSIHPSQSPLYTYIYGILKLVSLETPFHVGVFPGVPKHLQSWRWSSVLKPCLASPLVRHPDSKGLIRGLLALNITILPWAMRRWDHWVMSLKGNPWKTLYFVRKKRERRWKVDVFSIYFQTSTS